MRTSLSRCFDDSGFILFSCRGSNRPRVQKLLNSWQLSLPRPDLTRSRTASRDWASTTLSKHDNAASLYWTTTSPTSQPTRSKKAPTSKQATHPDQPSSKGSPSAPWMPPFFPSEHLAPLLIHFLVNWISETTSFRALVFLFQKFSACFSYITVHFSFKNFYLQTSIWQFDCRNESD